MVKLVFIKLLVVHMTDIEIEVSWYIDTNEISQNLLIGILVLEERNMYTYMYLHMRVLKASHNYLTLVLYLIAILGVGQCNNWRRSTEHKHTDTILGTFSSSTFALTSCNKATSAASR